MAPFLLRRKCTCLLGYMPCLSLLVFQKEKRSFDYMVRRESLVFCGKSSIMKKGDKLCNCSKGDRGQDIHFH